MRNRIAPIAAVLSMIAVLLSAAGQPALADRLSELALDGPARVRIEAGWFTMGSDDADVAHAVRLCQAGGARGPVCARERFAHEQPRHRVHSSAYLIDRTEVTNAAYRRCVGESVCAPPRLSESDLRLAHPRHPVAGVSHGEAQRYCRWGGGRLPTEAQWERAARGGSQRRYPWGQHYNSRVANHGDGRGDVDLLDGYRFAAPVGALSDGRSAHGLHDMGGNVWEWTADFYADSAYEQHRGVDPRGPAHGEGHVIRGGSWRSPPYTLRATHRGSLRPDDARPDVGFRCAYNVPRAAPAPAPGRKSP